MRDRDKQSDCGLQCIACVMLYGPLVQVDLRWLYDMYVLLRKRLVKVTCRTTGDHGRH